MAILVTGGAGFIGSALVRHLIEHTNQTIINVDKMDYSSSQQALAAVRTHPQYVFYHTNISHRQKLAEIFARHKPQAVFHLAAQTHVDRSIDSPRGFMESNIMGTFELLEVIRSYWHELPVKEQVAFRLIHISTDEVYGDLGLNDQPPLKEQSCYLPSSPYSASKAASDHLVRAWHRTYEFPVILTHCTNNYGPYQYPEKLIPYMINCALHERPLTIYGQGNQIRDWIHVTDHVRALHQIWAHGRIGQSYNISAEHRLTNIELVHKLCAHLDQIRPHQTLPSYAELITHVAERPGHDQRYALDASKLRYELGWQPEVDFEQGLRDTVRWYAEHL